MTSHSTISNHSAFISVYIALYLIVTFYSQAARIHTHNHSTRATRVLLACCSRVTRELLVSHSLQLVSTHYLVAELYRIIVMVLHMHPHMYVCTYVPSRITNFNIACSLSLKSFSTTYVVPVWRDN